MISILLARLHQKHRTFRYPDGPAPKVSDRLRGRPTLDPARCLPGCSVCRDVCPTGAAAAGPDGRLVMDLGRCLFCGRCAEACPQQAIAFTTDHRLAVSRREDLLLAAGAQLQLATAMGNRLRSFLGRSLRLRQVSAGGCNACEADSNVLTTVGWDLSRFGIKFVASPRHADGLLVTGPVSQNMALALKKTYDAVSDPRIVIAVGTCAISGGVFADRPEVCNGVSSVVPVDLYIPGCPPHPFTILDGLLRLIGRIGEGKR